MSVVLINPFEVPEGKESEALALWDRAQKLINGRSGYYASYNPNLSQAPLKIPRWLLFPELLYSLIAASRLCK
jgi:hypothetical protein